MKQTHPRLRPSSSQRWMACPGSIALVDQMIEKGLEVDRETDAARHGTKAHFYAECKIKSMYGPLAERDDWAAKAAKAREDLPDEIAKNAETYVSWVSSYLFGQTGE